MRRRTFKAEMTKSASTGPHVGWVTIDCDEVAAIVEYPTFTNVILKSGKEISVKESFATLNTLVFDTLSTP